MDTKILKTRGELIEWLDNNPRMLCIRLYRDKTDITYDAQTTMHAYRFSVLLQFAMGSELQRRNRLTLLDQVKLTKLYQQEFLDSQSERFGYQYDPQEMQFIEDMVDLFTLEIIEAQVTLKNNGEGLIKITTCNDWEILCLLQ